VEIGPLVASDGDAVTDFAIIAPISMNFDHIADDITFIDIVCIVVAAFSSYLIEFVASKGLCGYL
jgi:hypothetical protein